MVREMKRLIFTVLAAMLLAPAACAEDEVITRMKRDMPGLWANQHCAPVEASAAASTDEPTQNGSTRKSVLPKLQSAKAGQVKGMGTTTAAGASLY